MARRKDPVIPNAILDQLLAGVDAKTAFDQNGLLDQLKKALTERALKAELDHHLAGDESGNQSWLGKSEHRDKWSFGLKAASMRAAQEKR